MERPAFRLPLGERTLIMGVVNVTPDSFSDGGDLPTAQAAERRARELAAQGADILDIGGESTRPGSQGVPPEVELARTVPVFERLGPPFATPLSVDTSKAEIAVACLQRGARLVNDITAGRADPRIFDAARDHGAYLVLMHMQGTPRDMQHAPAYTDVVEEVGAFLEERARQAAARGVPKDRILVDPGIGFGKTLEHNLLLLQAVPRLKRLGYPVVVGASRKSMFKALLGIEDPKARDGATAHLTTYLAAQGVDVVRVHEVAKNREAARLGDALRVRPG